MSDVRDVQMIAAYHLTMICDYMLSHGPTDKHLHSQLQTKIISIIQSGRLNIVLNYMLRKFYHIKHTLRPFLYF